MARLDRKTQKVFASNANNNGVFGSLQAGEKTITNDVEKLQSLPAYEAGWNAATISSELLPPLEEFQAVNYINTYQEAYMFQEGIPEWNTDTTYYIGSLVKVISNNQPFLYFSKVDDNIGSDPLTSTDSWGTWGSLPDQTGNAGKFLTTDGTSPSWANVTTVQIEYLD